MGHRAIIMYAAAVAVAVPTVLAVGGAPPAEATDCWVRNVRTGVGSDDLQAAVNDSEQGDRLRVHGVCDAVQTYEQDIKLVGPATIGYPESTGWSDLTEILVFVTGGHVTLKDLHLVGGYSTHVGGAIYNQGGTVVLTGDTKVTRNRAEDGGGGIYNGGRVVMQGRAEVSDNVLLFGSGGGILNDGTLVMRNRARVADHDEGVFEGGGVSNAGTLIMRDVAAVEHNSAETGGGVRSTGTVRMGGSSRITGNTATGTGGGLSSTGTVWFSDWWRGTVCGNTPDDWPTCTP